jgi:hypothetical protein
MVAGTVRGMSIRFSWTRSTVVPRPWRSIFSGALESLCVCSVIRLSTDERMDGSSSALR